MTSGYDQGYQEGFKAALFQERQKRKTLYKKYRLARRAKSLIYAKAYAEKNKEKISAYGKKYRELHKEYYKAKSAKQYAKRKAQKV